jgi:hypothetical protein
MQRTWWSGCEILLAVDLAEQAQAHGAVARVVPGFPRYAQGLLVILFEGRRWAVPLHADGSVRFYEVFEPSDCQWQRWLIEWQDVAARWQQWVQLTAVMPTVSLIPSTEVPAQPPMVS